MTNEVPATHKLGLIASTSYVVGVIIGSGILVTPQSILLNTGSIGLDLIIWATCGLLSFIGAMVYVELGTSIPVSGADFSYLCYVKWHPFAFTFLWTTVLVYDPCGYAVQIRTIGNYFIQSIAPLFCLSPETSNIAGLMVGYMCVFFLAFLNFKEVSKYAANAQIAVTACKVILLLVIIGTGAYYIITVGTSNLSHPMEGTVWGGNLILALNGGMWAYDGWNILNFGIEDVHKPKRTLLLSSFAGLVIVTIIYLLTNIAYFAVLGKDGVLQSEAVAETFSQVMLGGFSYAIPIFVIIVLMGNINAGLFGSSRFLLAAAREGHLPSFMKLINVKYSSPQTNLFVINMLGMIMANVSAVDQLINTVIFIQWLQRLFSVGALIWIRLKHIPVNPNAVKLPLAIHFLFFFLSTAIVIVTVYEAPVVSAIGLGFASLGFVVYFLFVRPKELPGFLVNADKAVAKFCQILFLSMPAEGDNLKLTAITPDQVVPVNDNKEYGSITRFEKF